MYISRSHQQEQQIENNTPKHVSHFLVLHVGRRNESGGEGFVCAMQGM